MIRELESGSYVISSRQAWLPGVYDSERTARFAFRFPDATLRGLALRICSAQGEDRPITMDDLREARAEWRRSLRAPASGQQDER